MGGPKEFIVKATKPFPSYLYNVKIINPIEKPQDKYKWFQGLFILITDENFKDWYDIFGKGYLSAFYFKNVDEITTDGTYSPLDEGLQNTDNISMHNQYITTKLDTKCNNIKEAIINNHHIKNECWLNTCIDVWGDSLLSENRKEKIDRDKILEIIFFLKN